VNYNQVPVVVKCQILQECFLQNCNCKNFKIWNIQIQGLSRTSQGPYEPWYTHTRHTVEIQHSFTNKTCATDS